MECASIPFNICVGGADECGQTYPGLAINKNDNQIFYLQRCFGFTDRYVLLVGNTTGAHYGNVTGSVSGGGNGDFTVFDGTVMGAIVGSVSNTYANMMAQLSLDDFTVNQMYRLLCIIQVGSLYDSI